jgi:hypothetical protein
MQIIKESEAIMKVCPFISAGAEGKKHCVAKYCMAWVPVQENMFLDSESKTAAGYCAKIFN